MTLYRSPSVRFGDPMEIVSAASSSEVSYEPPALYIDGRWLPSTGGSRIDVQSPSTEAMIGSYPLAATADVDRAVSAARVALRASEWAGLTPAERGEVLERFADELEKSSADRARLTTQQNGMPISVASAVEGEAPVGVLRYYAALAQGVQREERRPRIDGQGTTLVVREPVGVVGMLVPWNFPQVLTMFKLAPALAAGCTVVLKPAPETSLDAFALAAAAERAGLPAGVLNIVTGGADIGSYLVAHPGVDKVAFTGSTPVGRAIGEACGKLLRPVTLELGGKSAAIVLDDADVAEVAQGLAMTSLLNSGQTCYLSTRILVPESRHDEVLDAVAAAVSALPVGDPLNPETFVGPMVSRRQRDRVQAYIDNAKAAGNRVAAGGGAAPHPQGWYVQPTVFGAVSNTDPVAREEIFGPVLCVIPYSGVDEAIAIANDNDYGLGGTVWTRDVDKGVEVARHVETGSVGVNFYSLDVGAPFGGVKASGLGRELGPEGLEAYFQLKSIFLNA